MDIDLLRLDSQFNAVGATMSVTEYNLKRAELVTRAANAPKPVVVPPAPVDPDQRALSFGSFTRIMKTLITGIAEKINHRAAAADQRIAELEKRLAPILETQRGLLARLDKSAETIASLERRASRQSDHLAKLESRLQSLEHK